MQRPLCRGTRRAGGRMPPLPLPTPNAPKSIRPRPSAVTRVHSEPSPQQQPCPVGRPLGVPPISRQQALRCQAEWLWEVGEEPEGLRRGRWASGQAARQGREGRSAEKLGAALHRVCEGGLAGQNPKP